MYVIHGIADEELAAKSGQLASGPSARRPRWRPPPRGGRGSRAEERRRGGEVKLGAASRQAGRTRIPRCRGGRDETQYTHNIPKRPITPWPRGCDSMVMLYVAFGVTPCDTMLRYDELCC